MFKEICSDGYIIIYGNDVRECGEQICKVPVIDTETGEYVNLKAFNMVDARTLVDYARTCEYYKPA